VRNSKTILSGLTGSILTLFAVFFFYGLPAQSETTSGIGEKIQKPSPKYEMYSCPTQDSAFEIAEKMFNIGRKNKNTDPESINFFVPTSSAEKLTMENKGPMSTAHGFLMLSELNGKEIEKKVDTYDLILWLETKRVCLMMSGYRFKESDPEAWMKVRNSTGEAIREIEEE
jgi:hypothetical protein